MFNIAMAPSINPTNGRRSLSASRISISSRTECHVFSYSTRYPLSWCTTTLDQLQQFGILLASSSYNDSFTRVSRGDGAPFSSHTVLGCGDCIIKLILSPPVSCGEGAPFSSLTARLLRLYNLNPPLLSSTHCHSACFVSS
jgi:hypothetical protein